MGVRLVAEDWDIPFQGPGDKARGVDREPIRGSHQGQRPCVPR
jgi:hypothetical protein